MGISILLDEPLYRGGGVSNLVPYPYDVAIAGRPYVVDFEFTPFRREAYRHKSIELLRPQADTGSVPDESTVNPEGLWRRSQDTWHHGAGQPYLDRKSSDLSRFRYSKGMDVWTPWQMAVLNDTEVGYATIGTGLGVLATAARVYIADGAVLSWTTTPFSTPITPTQITLPAAISSMCTDGFDVYLAVGASGVYRITDTTNVAAQLVSTGIGTSAVVGYCLGRLMVGDGNKLYNITSATVAALPAVLATSYLSSTFAWVGFAEGTGNIYAAGNLGNQGQVFKIAITADGTALGAPSAAMPGLPKGELITAIYGYLGVILIGTSKGVRVATADAAGNLTVGSLITTPNSVRSFEGQDRFVWFGYTNFDGASSGLGRLDLSTIGVLPNAPTTPAWASDLMAVGQGRVRGIASWTAGGFTGRVFTVDGIGLMVERQSVPVTGVLQTGFITYDLSDLKYAVFVDALAGNQTGTLSVAVSNDGGTFTPCGTQAVGADSHLEFGAPQTASSTIEVQYSLTSAASAGSGASATVHRTTLRSMVAAVSSTNFVIPIRLSPKELVDDVPTPFTPSVELAFLDELRQARSIVTYQEGYQSYAVVVDNLDWTPQQIDPVSKEMAGIVVVTMTTIT